MNDERYTHGHGDAVLRSHRWRTVENSASYLLPHLEPGQQLLDVGCGPGNLTVDLARRVAPGRVVGCDLAADIVDQAAETYRDVVNVTFEVADLYRLPYADATFDVVHAHQVIQHVAHPVAALEEMARVTRTGGVIAVREADYGSFAWHPGDHHLDRWLEIYGAVTRSNRGEPNAGRFLKAWARAAGLEDLTVTVTAWSFTTPEEQAWWSALWAERITTSPLAARAVELGISTDEELAEVAAAWRRWGADPDGSFSLPSTELLARVHR